jgi:hypothetical protein
MHTILLIVFFPVQAPLKDLSMQKPFSSWGDRVHDDIDKVLAGLSTWELRGAILTLQIALRLADISMLVPQLVRI